MKSFGFPNFMSRRDRIGVAPATLLMSAALLSLAASPSRASDEHCETPPYTGVSAGSTRATNNWKVVKDNICNYHFTMNVPYSYLFDTIAISKRAAHGVTGVNKSITSAGFAYKPNPGFTGSDTFQATWKMKVPWSEAPQQFYVDVVVDVVDKF
jgi:hypothetical protein